MNEQTQRQGVRREEKKKQEQGREQKKRKEKERLPRDNITTRMEAKPNTNFERTKRERQGVRGQRAPKETEI
jgi:hypothetical protein